MSFPYLFTEAEQLAAYRLLFDEAEAQELAAGADAMNSRLFQPGGSIGISYTEATLILLSLVSPDLAARVDAHRREPFRDDEKQWAEAQEQWEKSRADILMHVRARQEMKQSVSESSDAG